MQIKTEKTYTSAVAKLKAAALAYYDTDSLVMDDGEYDDLLRSVQAWEDAHPDSARSGIADKVAGGQSRGGNVAHSAPMLSLDNAYSDDDVTAWFDRLARVVSAPQIELCVEPKLDGLALAARYVNGQLVAVLTRGDGETGEDVTRRAKDAVGLPGMLSESITIEIRGECVMTGVQFEAANEVRVADGKSPFANPRNAVAGVIRKIHGDTAIPVTFCAYGAVGHEWADELSHTALMAKLEALGVGSALQMARQFGAGAVTTAADAMKVCSEIARNRGALDCGIDGAVVKANDAAVRQEAGATGKAPRWAVARKFPPDTKLTTLLDIETSVGRTGALTVRAILEPVAVGGVTISSCTLSNPSEIARKDLRIGDKVWVRRAGEVIPEITGVAVEHRAEDSQPWQAPTECARCGETLENSQKIWRCPNGRDCGLLESLMYAVSRDALDIEGLGEKVLKQLVEKAVLTDIADIYALTSDTIASLERMGETSAQKIMNEIEASKALPFSRVLTSLGVRKTGRRICRRLASHFISMDALCSASVEDLSVVEGVGAVRAEFIHGELQELADVISRLNALGVGRDEVVTEKAAGGALDGLRVCVTGSVPGYTRDGAQALVESLGGVAVSSVSKKTDLLVVGDGGGSKAAKAVELGVRVMTAQELIALI